MPEVSSNKRIAKNTVMLYIRMFISMLVGLYTSRVVLQTLGVDDYGTYGVVGGIVSMMGFINSSMAGATSRFITFELGRGDLHRVRDTFSSALIVHMMIAVIIIILGETVGLWFLCNKLVIPEGRMEAAHWVYQFSIISAAVGVTQAPYSAVIMSHEKMDIYAYFELLNVTLKLVIVYLLTIGNFDKLILYALLTLAVSLFMRFLYRIYCVKHFDESHFRWIWNKEIFKPMLSFSGWDLFGNLSVTFKQQGVNFLINIFFGVVYNAAASVAATIEGTLMGLCNNIVVAFRPQIIKQYSIGNYHSSVNLIYLAGKISAILMVIFVVPISFFIDYILQLWLVNPPEYASVFCRIMFISGCINIYTCVFNVGINATGRMRKMSFSTGICFISLIPILYICYYYKCSVEWAYYLAIILSFVTTGIRAYILRQYIKEFNFYDLFRHSILPVFIIIIILVSFSYLLNRLLENDIYGFLILLITNVLIGCVSVFYIAINNLQRKKIITLLNKYIHIK